MERFPKTTAQTVGHANTQCCKRAGSPRLNIHCTTGGAHRLPGVSKGREDRQWMESRVCVFVLAGGVFDSFRVVCWE